MASRRQRRRRGNRQGTPALPSERIAGSSRNAPRTAASLSAAEDIVLTPELLESLKRKVTEHNEAMRSRRAPSHRYASLAMLKAVLRRGMGAYSTSHRPNVTSRQQWGLARVNAFLRLLSAGRPLDPKYVSDNDLLPRGHERSTKTKALPTVDAEGRYRVKVASHVPIQAKAARRVKLVWAQYNPNARDGDNDGIVQEGTIWERPKGTHFVDSLGRRIESTLDERRKRRRNKQTGGAHPEEYHPSFRLVDKDNRVVAYTPTWSPERSGARTARRTGPSIGERIGVVGRPAPSKGTVPDRPTAAEENDLAARRRPSTPHRFSRLAKEQRDNIVRIWRNGVTVKQKDGTLRKVPGSKRKTLNDVVDHGLGVLGELDPRGEEWLAGRHWYEQQHHQIREMADRLGVDFDIAVAVVAATSVRNAWDQWRKPRGDERWRVVDPKDKEWTLATPNLDLAEYILKNAQRDLQERHTVDAAELRNEMRSASLSTEGLEDLQSGTYRLKDLPVAAQAMIIARNAAREQDYGTGFMSSGVANALRIIETGDIDAHLHGPKVRSFFDNIYHFNESDAVTIDSIMIQFATGLNSEDAGELLKRIGGMGRIYDRFGNTVDSNYGIYAYVAEAIHLITKDWNQAHPDDQLTPSDVQAILWFYQRNISGIDVGDME